MVLSHAAHIAAKITLREEAKHVILATETSLKYHTSAFAGVWMDCEVLPSVLRIISRSLTNITNKHID